MKIRLDALLLQLGLAASIEKARALIGAGRVLVNDKPADKAGNLFAPTSTIRLRGQTGPYVSRGGLKLAAGLAFFAIKPEGMICADIGASTGGFTDCLLQAGAAKVYAVDVGYGQLAWKLRQDSRVVVLERTNARNLRTGDLADLLDLAVIDASFISLRQLLPPLLPLFSSQPRILALIKPQFEAQRKMVGPGGVIRDHSVHQAVIEDVRRLALSLGLSAGRTVPSPILGPKGNQEFLILFAG